MALMYSKGMPVGTRAPGSWLLIGDSKFKRGIGEIEEMTYCTFYEVRMAMGCNWAPKGCMERATNARLVPKTDAHKMQTVPRGTGARWDSSQ